MDMYTIDHLHYNRQDIVQVSPEECFEDLASTMNRLEAQLKTGLGLEPKMFSFFEKEVEPLVAYRDNDVNQGEEGPRRLHVVGKLKRINGDNGLFVRLGISTPDENPLIPSLQALYLSNAQHAQYIGGEPVGITNDPDRWAYDFTSRYQGMVEGVKVRTRLGIKSLSVIPAINEAILNGNTKMLEDPKYH